MEVNEQRFAYYYKKAIENPGKDIIIPKKKGMKSPQAIHNERIAIVDRIEACLKLADISYRRNRYKIRVYLQQTSPWLSGSSGMIDSFRFIGDDRQMKPIFGMDSGSGITSMIRGRRSDKCLIIDDYYSLSESNPDAKLKILDSLSAAHHHLVTFGKDQRQVLEEGVVMDEYPSMESLVQHTSWPIPTTTDTYPNPVKLIISAIRDSAATRNTLSW
jgi:hypothetical protein